MASPSQEILAILHEVVGRRQNDETLVAAWRRAGCNLAGTVNLLLDSRAEACAIPSATVNAKAALPQRSGKSSSASSRLDASRGRHDGSKASETISLDDSDDEGVRGSCTTVAAAIGASLPTATRSHLRARSRSRSRGSRQSPPSRRSAKSNPPFEDQGSCNDAAGFPDVRTCGSHLPRLAKLAKASLDAVEFDCTFMLGTVLVDAYSTTSVCKERLQKGDQVDLRVGLIVRKGKHRVGGSDSVAVGRDRSSVRFYANGSEVGRFPAWAARMLVPLLSRRVIDADAVVGEMPPRVLSLGTTVPVEVRVWLRSTALCAPGQWAVSSAVNGAGSESVALGLGAKSMAAQQDEENVEIHRTAMALLLQRLGLRRRGVAAGDQESGCVDTEDRCGDANGDGGCGGDIAQTFSRQAGVVSVSHVGCQDTGNKSIAVAEKEIGGTIEGEDEDGDATGGAAASGEEEMSRLAAAQLGGGASLERFDLPCVALPEDHFVSRLRHYQGQAVYWMWRRENPGAQLPLSLFADPVRVGENNKQSSGAGSACGFDGCEASSAADSGQLLHPMWDEYELERPVWLPRRVGDTSSVGECTVVSSDNRQLVGEDAKRVVAATSLLPAQTVSKFLYHHRTTGALSLDFPDTTSAHSRGGILADDMGLGKTVMCLGLIALDSILGVVGGGTTGEDCSVGSTSLAEDDVAARMPRQRRRTAFFASGSCSIRGGTLVVAPLSLIKQWRAEAERHFAVRARLVVHEYHGGGDSAATGRNGRHASPQQLRSADLVLTTFGTLASERTDGALFQVHWRRVILDEAHSIKNRLSRQARAAFQLKTDTRWCVTGTPLQNSVEELFSLVRFLRVDPWSSWTEWRRAVALPLERGRHGDGVAMTTALNAARRIVQPLLIRRTKASRDPETGEPLLVLPPKHLHVVELQLSAGERDFYDALYSRSKTQFDTFVARGEVLAKFHHILLMILKLRQALCHPFLVFARPGAGDEDLESVQSRCIRDMGGDVNAQKFVGSVMEDLRKGDLADCPICCDSPEDPTMTPCGHIFCRECALKIVDQCSGECPVCRRPGVSRKSLRVLPGASRFPSGLMTRSEETGGNKLPPQSTKMKEFLTLLRDDMAAGRRAVAFSQWTSFLDLLEASLDAAGIQWRRFDGTLSSQERQRRVAWLGEPTDHVDAGDGGHGSGAGGCGRVLLISLKAGGVGLNLVAATRVYMLDLWWNPAVEEQAIQRVHRIGQSSDVHVYKFVVADSIDAALLDLHRAKERLLEDAISGGRPQEGSGKLSVEDLRRIFSPCRSSLSSLRSDGNGSTGKHIAASALAQTRSSGLDSDRLGDGKIVADDAAGDPAFVRSSAPVTSDAARSIQTPPGSAETAVALVSTAAPSPPEMTLGSSHPSVLWSAMPAEDL
eukprot:TRINITY_DN24001_c0_g1_i1.p1 TRINITY_DN24001_c0_g1~~TRINITY_DN24001_c0_g1_i1.p1  ORF type:complete len:1399 (+),score=252.81 TRINITY_DN24001_c0_g1_i1:147-4343(+)